MFIISEFKHLPWICIAIVAMLSGSVQAQGEGAVPIPPSPVRDLDSKANLFRQENLVAWCIVPFDAKKRSAVERAKMLRELGFTQFAYDYRAEHIPTFEEEIEETRKQGIKIIAWWFPGRLNDEAKSILKIFKKQNVAPQLWVTGGGDPTLTGEAEKAFIESEVQRLRAIADAGAEVGCTLGLYNHGGWFGVPENLLKLMKGIDRPNVGIVYNLHHAHDQLHRLPQVLELLAPHLLVLNVNGMETNGEAKGKKILIIGEGDQDRKVFQTIVESSYRGPIGILNHTDHDAQQRLEENLTGLREVTK